MKNVLVFGSSGFIGSALCKKFKAEGYEVYGCDLSNTNGNEINHFFPGTELEANPESIFSIPYDVCINCAGSASVPYSFLEPFKDYELNTRIVFRILNELKRVNSKARFINMSSAAVYGNPQALPIRETDALLPISPYGNHKLMSEIIVDQFRNHFNMEGISLRIFSAYGPGLKKQIFWDIYQKSLKHKVIPMHGTGNESRDFIFIDDLAQAIFLIATQPTKPYAVYNVANGTEITIQEVVSQFCEASGNGLKFEFNGEVRTGDPTNWCADISRLKELGYNPTYDLKKGISTLVQWLNQQK